MDSFRTIAEIAATLVGFVAIFIAFRAASTPVPKSDFIDFLQSAIAAIIFAFIPELLQGVTTSDASAWQISCLLFGTYHLAIMLYASVLHIKHQTFGGITMRAFLLASSIVVALKLLVGFNVLSAYAYEIYLLGLLWMILNSLYVFYGIVSRAAD